MLVLKRRTAILSLMLFSIIGSSGVLSACSFESPEPAATTAASRWRPWDPATPTTPAPAPSNTTVPPTAKPTSVAPTPKPTPIPKATVIPKATPKAAPKASSPTPPPGAPKPAPKPAPAKTYPNIAIGKLAWNSRGCLYSWSGTGWQSKNLCRTPRGEPRDYTYTNTSGRMLFTAVTDPTSALIYWSDAKLVYQQYTNMSRHTYLNGTFGAYLLQQASFDDGSSYAIDDFFGQSTKLAAFKRAHPNADLSRSTRDNQWFVFYNFWRPAILAGNCAPNYLCP